MPYANPHPLFLAGLRSPRGLVAGALSAVALAGCGSDDPPGQADALTSNDVATTDDAAVTEDVTAPLDVAETPDLATEDDTTMAEDSVTPPDDTTAPHGLPTELSAAPDRSAVVVYPPDVDPEGGPYPLALLLHGYGASGAIQDTYLDFSPRASERGWIVVIPDGTVDNTGKRFWNASPSWCCDFGNTGIDDTTYLSNLLTKARTELPVDPDRVFIVGHSNGAYMAHRLACTNADLISGIVAIAGGLPDAVNACAPSRPVALWQIHGTADTVVYYNGQAGTYPGSRDVADRWSSYNGCSTDLPSVTPLSRDYDPAIVGDETDVLTYSACPSGAPVTLWTLNGSSHVPFFSANFMLDVLSGLETLPQ